VEASFGDYNTKLIKNKNRVEMRSSPLGGGNTFIPLEGEKRGSFEYAIFFVLYYIIFYYIQNCEYQKKLFFETTFG
jgi:hypothetical protein